MNKKVLVASLNWGLGYAYRCIPIITALLDQGLEPVIASDGEALALLQNEFPSLTTVSLPSYTSAYPLIKSNSKVLYFSNRGNIEQIVKEEKKIIKGILAKDSYHGIISDNRFGARNKHAPSVFITHRLRVLNDKTTLFNSKMHSKYLKKFDVCWVPDMADDPNLSGELGHPEKNTIPVTYLGPLSRFSYQNLPKIHDVMVLLSGPEPQRTFLEKKLFQEFGQSDKRILFVRGTEKGPNKTYVKNNMTVYNHLSGIALQNAINSSKLVIARSGYTTVMDLAKLKKKAFFIPTPGQTEQEYIAKQLHTNKLVPSCNQQEFSLKKLRDLNNYKGLCSFSTDINYGELFHFFQRK